MKTLVLFYSYGGNTRRIAKLIQEELDCDLAEIETEKPYTGSYNDVVNQGQREVNSNFQPKLKPILADINSYDRIILGSPVWWYTYAPAMNAFLHEYDLTGKEIWPFATNGGWIGHTFKDFQRACNGALVKTGLNVQFDKATMRTSEKEISTWIKNINK